MAEANAIELLAEFHSWQLNRVSLTTYPQDIVSTARRQSQPLTEDEAVAVVRLMRAGSCYRCRIGKGRYYFGVTPREAIDQAIAAENAKSKPTE